MAPPAYGKTIVQILVVVLLLVILLLNLFTFVFSVVQYYGKGMEPTLEDGQILIIRKTDQVKRGDMIAFYFNNSVLVRRVICTGGDTIDIHDSGVVYVNNTRLEEPYVERASIGQYNISFPYVVPVGQYFVMGDNRSISMDSRLSELGSIPESRVLGKIVFII